VIKIREAKKGKTLIGWVPFFKTTRTMLVMLLPVFQQVFSDFDNKFN